MLTKIKMQKQAHRCSTSIVVKDDNLNTFSMEIGGNTDLYWIVKGKGEKFVFNIGKNNDFYPYLDSLYKDIEKVDNKNHPTIEGNTFYWLSEDRPPEDANHLTIDKNNDNFVITFHKNPKNFYPMCVTCFCNSGSYHPNIEILFMEMFNTLSRSELDEEPTSE